MKRYLLCGSPMCHSRPHSASELGTCSPGCSRRGLRGLNGSPSAAIASPLPLDRGVDIVGLGTGPPHLGRCLQCMSACFVQHN